MPSGTILLFGKQDGEEPRALGSLWEFFFTAWRYNLDFWRGSDVRCEIPSHKPCWFAIMPRRREFRQSGAVNLERAAGATLVDFCACAFSPSGPNCARDAGVHNHRAWADGRAS
jgi:hypothetical protein